MRKIFFIFQFIIIFLSMAFLNAKGLDNVDLLLNKLISKGIITENEKKEIMSDSEKKKAFIKFYGDYRLRYQTEEKKDSNGKIYYRDRTRMRFRLKGDANVSDNLMIKFGIATGGQDPRSTNQTLENGFEPKNIYLDYAYAQYTCPIFGNVYAGKFENKNIIWTPSDLMWDGDINLEGFGISKDLKLGNSNITFNSGYLFLDELNGRDNISMFVFQPVVTLKISENADFKLAPSMYYFSKLKGNSLPYSVLSNTNSGNLKYDYNCYSVGTEINFYDILLPKIGFFAEGVINPDPDDANKGFLGGVQVGSKKIKEFGDWEIKAMYRELQKDAWLDIFPDSDTLGGKTDNQGMEMILNLGLTNNVSLGVDYYSIGNIGKDNKKDLVQADINIKF
jgi:hypothetical protein